jgi:hypothetical protein
MLLSQIKEVSCKSFAECRGLIMVGGSGMVDRDLGRSAHSKPAIRDHFNAVVETGLRKDRFAPPQHICSLRTEMVQ